jgi:hypothetical protein
MLPERRDKVGEFVHRVPATVAAIRTDEVCVAPPCAGTQRALAMLGTTRPEIAAAEAQEDGGPSSVHALALQRIEDFFDGVAHVDYAA